jgi:hypothetical protein
MHDNRTGDLLPLKKHIWADSTKEWEGFAFTTYSFDWKKLEVMPLALESGQLPPEEERSEDAATKDRPLTVGAIYSRIAACKFEVEERRPAVFRGLKVKTENGEVVLKGPSFNCEMLWELLALKADGIEPDFSQWFWYDSDYYSDSAVFHKRYNFFVVSGDRIVRENVSFADYHHSGFDPAIFVSFDNSDSSWFNDSEWREATIRFWYRKFYTETRTGQLIVLRPDEPILYHYERPQTRNIARELQFVTLLKTYRLLWVALPLLVALAFPSLKEYMAIAAAVLGVEFLRLCWSTRKVGKP